MLTTTMIDRNQISALIKLLDDSDKEVYTHIESKLLTFGKDVIPILENAWTQSFDSLLQQRIENIIHKIQLDQLQVELKTWSESITQDVIAGAILVARYQYPDLDEEHLRSQIEKIKRDVWLEMNDQLTAFEKVTVLNRVLFDIHDFSGNTQNYHAPQNSFINVALESRKGNPLMLAIIYSEVARSVGMPVYGVNLPEHFILAYKDEHLTGIADYADEKNKILFYINPFSKGSIFGRAEIDTFLKQLKLEQTPSYYAPCTNLDIIQRLIRNLMNSYFKLGFLDKVSELELIMKAVTK